jgi:hypothetical protein
VGARREETQVVSPDLPHPHRPDDAAAFVAGLEADLQALAAAEADLERDSEVAERTRIERGSVTLADRLAAARGPVEIATAGGGRHSGLVTDSGDGWVLLDHTPVGQRAATAEHLVRTDAVHGVRGLGRPRTVARGVLPPRSLAAVLRGWCRDRAEVSVLLLDGGATAGLASAAYADHLELSTGGGATLAVPFAAMAVVSR